MKEYIKPQLIEEVIELEDIIATSVGEEADTDVTNVFKDVFGFLN